MELVNGERESRNMGSLSVRGDVVAIAHPHSRNMAGRRTIWHNDAYFNESTRTSLRSAARGENVAMNASLEDAHRRLMASPGHRANILNGGFTQAGFSVVQDEAGTLYVTQNFMTPEGGKATASPARHNNAEVKASAGKSGEAKATRAKGRKARVASARKARVSRAKGSSARGDSSGGARRARTVQRAGR